MNHIYLGLLNSLRVFSQSKDSIKILNSVCVSENKRERGRERDSQLLTSPVGSIKKKTSIISFSNNHLKHIIREEKQLIFLLRVSTVLFFNVSNP